LINLHRPKVTTLVKLTYQNHVNWKPVSISQLDTKSKCF